jgi:N-acetylglutamate synthase-like GNAT family acetyltransferase
VQPQVRTGTASDADGCVRLLAELPDFFTPETHDQVRAELAAGDRAWVAEEGGVIIGFVLAQPRYAATAEITFAAVLPEWRNRGVGTALVQRALSDMADGGISVVLVKTLDASAGYQPYVATRAFWSARGFYQVDCIDPLPGWQPGNPAALLVVALRPTR